MIADGILWFLNLMTTGGLVRSKMVPIVPLGSMLLLAELTNVEGFPVTISSRVPKKIVIHGGYKPELLDRSYNDIALIKFDRPFFPETVTHAKIMPICLPPSSTFEDEGKPGGTY